MYTERDTNQNSTKFYAESVQLMGDFFSSFFFRFAKTTIGMKLELPVTVYNVNKNGGGGGLYSTILHMLYLVHLILSFVPIGYVS
jgi:hypothetical protein